MSLSRVNSAMGTFTMLNVRFHPTQWLRLSPTFGLSFLAACGATALDPTASGSGEQANQTDKLGQAIAMLAGECPNDAAILWSMYENGQLSWADNHASGACGFDGCSGVGAGWTTIDYGVASLPVTWIAGLLRHEVGHAIKGYHDYAGTHENDNDSSCS